MLMNLHPSITSERVCNAAEESVFGFDNPGICTACGVDAEGVDPEACGIKCEVCGEKAVYGAEELLLEMA